MHGHMHCRFGLSSFRALHICHGMHMAVSSFMFIREHIEIKGTGPTGRVYKS